MKRAWKQRAWIGAVLALAGLGTAFAMLGERDPAAQHLATVGKGSFDVRVEAVGVLDAVRAYQIVSTLRGDKGKIVSIIDDGVRVTANEVLVRFDPTPFEVDIQRLSGELSSREALADSARQAVALEKTQVDRSLRSGEFEVQSAKQDYGRYLAYIADLELLLKEGHPVANEVLQAKRKSELMLTKLQKVESDLALLQKEIVFKIGHVMAEQNRIDSELAATRGALAQARSELAKSAIVAPIDGFVVLSEIFQNNQKRKPRAGDTVWPGQPILYLPDLSAMMIKSQVREEDLHKLRPGQQVSVHIDAYPDAVFSGELQNVGVLALENASTAGKHFQFSVRLKGSDPRLRPGMTARVSIVTDHIRNALTVPLTALFAEDGRRYCYVVEGSRSERRLVRVGRSNEDVAELLGGLAEGARVSLVKP